MSDHMTSFDPMNPQPDIRTAAAPGTTSFFKTKPGKIFIGLAVLAVLLAVVALIAFNFLLNTGSDMQVSLVKEEAASPSAETSTTTQTVAAEEPEQVATEDVYTFRDVFVPTITLASSTTPSNSTPSTSSDTSATTSSANTLLLQDVTNENGEDVAVVVWNGTTYTLTEGEAIPNSPWKVMTINESSVVMQYGDQPITLTVGVGVTK